MATRRVPFQFHCDACNFTHLHDIPSNLVRANITSNDGYLDTFSANILPIITLHKDQAMAASKSTCNACKTMPTKTVLMSPVSYLHDVDNPLVIVLVKPICDNKSCDEKGKRETQAMMNEIAKGDYKEADFKAATDRDAHGEKKEPPSE